MTLPCRQCGKTKHESMVAIGTSNIDAQWVAVVCHGCAGSARAAEEWVKRLAIWHARRIKATASWKG